MKKAALFCLVLLLLLPLCALGESYEAVIANPSAADRLNLRKKPSESAESLGRFYSGTPVTVLQEDEDGWAYIRLGDLTGYVNASYLMKKNRNYGAPQNFYTAQTTGNSVPLRKGAKNSAGLISAIQGQVEILGDIGDDWRYVYSPSADAYGYVRANQLKNRKVDIFLAYLQGDTSVYSDKNLKKEIARYSSGTPVRVTDLNRSGYAKVEIYGLPYPNEFEQKALEGYIALTNLNVFTQSWHVSSHAYTYQALSAFSFNSLYDGQYITVPRGACVAVIGETDAKYHIVYGQADGISYSTALVSKTLLHSTGLKAGHTGPGCTGYALLSMETDPEGYSLGAATYEIPGQKEDERAYRPLAEVLSDENGFLQLRNPDDKNFFVPNTQAKVITRDQLQVNSFRIVLPGETWTAGENDEGMWGFSVEKGQSACLTVTDTATNKHEVYDVKALKERANYAVYIPAGAQVSLTGTGSLCSNLHFELNRQIRWHDFEEDEVLFSGSGRFFCNDNIMDLGTWFDYVIQPMPGAEESYCVLSNLFTEAGEELKIEFDENIPSFRTNRWDLCPGTFLELHNCVIYPYYGNG